MDTERHMDFLVSCCFKGSSHVIESRETVTCQESSTPVLGGYYYTDHSLWLGHNIDHLRTYKFHDTQESHL